MILSSTTILKELEKGGICITDFKMEHLNPNSYDLTLSNMLAMYAKHSVYDGVFLDAKTDNKILYVSIPENGYVLMPNTLYLASVNEQIVSGQFLPMLEGKSSVGRLGIDIHISAGFGDVGFEGYWTLEMRCVHPVRIYANMKIAQVSFETVSEPPIAPYKGSYQYQGKLPNPSKSKTSCF